MKYPILVICLLVTSVAPTLGASSFLGPSGNIVAPGDITLPQNTWEIGYHQFVGVFGDVDTNIFSLNYGLADNLEVGAVLADNDVSDDIILNAKYRLLDETAASPSITVGVFNIGARADIFGDDPSLYAVASKRLTPAAPEVLDPTGQLRVNLGIGSGIFNGIFSGVDFVLEPRTMFMIEYLNNDLATPGTAGSSVNTGFRFTPIPNLSLDAALIDFSDLAFGASFRIGF